LHTLKKYKSFIFAFTTVLLFLYTMIISAWISDDILISLSQIVNFHHGDGLVFNYGERVQAFTHPSWFFLLSLLTYITNDYYYSIIFISILLSLGSIAIILYYSYKFKQINLAIATLGLLIFSKAFVDYSTSGLENPLSYFLFSIVLYILFSHKRLNEKHLFSLYFLFTFIFLNRMDYALILLPIVLYLILKYKNKNITPLMIASTITISWFLFSLFYFGHFFPNTFYAKLKAGYHSKEFIERGLQYFQVQYNNDPITLLIITLGISIGIFYNSKSRVVAIGLILYMLYFLKSGGDFMQGRFFATPALISIFLIVYFSIEKKVSIFLYIILIPLVYIGANRTSPLLVDKNYKNLQFVMGVADERGFYYQAYGLISSNRNWPKITTLSNKQPKQAKPICAKLGAEALSNRDNIFFVDICALSDPLLSQLPAIHHPNWRIGHQARDIPINYIDAVLNDNILLQDKQVNELYKDIKKVTRGKLFTINRLKAIYRVNTFNYNIDKNRYKNPVNHN